MGHLKEKSAASNTGKPKHQLLSWYKKGSNRSEANALAILKYIGAYSQPSYLTSLLIVIGCGMPGFSDC